MKNVEETAKKLKSISEEIRNLPASEEEMSKSEEIEKLEATDEELKNLLAMEKAAARKSEERAKMFKAIIEEQWVLFAREEKALHTSEERVKQLEVVNERLLNQLTSVEKEMQNSKERAKKLGATNKRLLDQLDAEEKSMLKCKDRAKKFEVVNERLLNQLAVAEDKAQDYKNTSDQYEEIIEKLKKQLASEKELVQEFKERAGKSEATNEELRNQLDRSKEVTQKLWDNIVETKDFNMQFLKACEQQLKALRTALEENSNVVESNKDAISIIESESIDPQLDISGRQEKQALKVKQGGNLDKTIFDLASLLDSMAVVQANDTRVNRNPDQTLLENGSNKEKFLEHFEVLPKDCEIHRVTKNVEQAVSMLTEPNKAPLLQEKAAKAGISKPTGRDQRIEKTWQQEEDEKSWLQEEDVSEEDHIQEMVNVLNQWEEDNLASILNVTKAKGALLLMLHNREKRAAMATQPNFESLCRIVEKQKKTIEKLEDEVEMYRQLLQYYQKQSKEAEQKER